MNWSYYFQKRIDTAPYVILPPLPKKIIIFILSQHYSPSYWLHTHCLVRSYLRQRGHCGTAHLTSHRQQRCDAKRYSSRGTFRRQPERYPRHKYYQGSWYIDLNDVISELTSKIEHRHQATEWTCERGIWLFYGLNNTANLKSNRSIDILRREHNDWQFIIDITLDALL